jgi:acyl-CoA dehydrogenase
MTTYKAPIEDMMFLYNELLDNKHFREIDQYKEINSELVQSIISEGAKMTENIIFAPSEIIDCTSSELISLY